MLFHLLTVLAINVLVNAQSGDIVDQLSCKFDGDHPNGDYCNYRVPANSSSIDWSLESSSVDRWSAALDGPLHGLEGSVSFLQHRGLAAQHSWNRPLAGVLYSTMAPLDGQYCLSLDYYVVGSESSILITRRNFDSPDREIIRLNAIGENDTYVFFRSERAANADEWSHYESTLHFNPDNYLFIIDGHGVAALDNLQLKKGPCANLGHEEVLTCNFDGHYRRGVQETCNWLSFSGPWQIEHARDHTTGSESFGDYLQLHSGPSNFNTQRAELRTKIFTPDDGPRCLYFWVNDYSAYEYNVSEVAVESGLVTYFLPQTDEDHRMFPNSLQGGWVPKSVDVDPAVPIQIVFKVEGSQSGIGFDSFELHKGKCPGPGNCDFSKSNCNYALQNSQVRWYRGNGRVARPGARRRDVDRDEKFLYLDFSEFLISPPVNRRPGPFAIGWLYSELIYAPGTYCLQFEYYAERVRYIHLRMPGRLTSFPRQTDYLSETHVVHVRTVEDSARWWTGFAVVKTQEPWRVELTVGGTGIHTRFELKSMRLDRNSCAEVEMMRNWTVTFSEVRFHCYQTGHYIPQHRTCDGVIDCPMGEDEAEQCEKYECSQGGIPCSRRGHTFCLAKQSEFCNGVQYCDDAVDEDPRLCDKESYCNNYCLNDGTCAQEAGDFNCYCPEGTQGKRCQIMNQNEE